MDRSFKPAHDGYVERVTNSFNRQEVMKTLQVSLVSIRPGEVELEFPYQPQLTQQHGFIHAGVVSTVLDSACGYAAFSLMPEEAAVLTIEFKVNLLAPASGERFLARAKVKKPGRNITVADGELFAINRDTPKLVASMTGTLMAVFDRKDVTQ
jgi:uncharacterized protein (TIGR00369 family)